MNSKSVEKFKKELMIKFPEIFSEGFGTCTKAKATFKIKVDMTPILRSKRKVSLTAEASISKEFEYLEQIGIKIYF